MYDIIINQNKNIINLLKVAGQLGDTLEKPVFVVGGFVRNLILGIQDCYIDIVIEGDGMRN